MQGLQRIVVLLAIGNMVIYIPYFLILGIATSANGIQLNPMAIMPWHVAGMFLNLLALIATFQDLYLRPFSNPNSKVTWCLLILCTGGIGWIVYVFRYALKPR